MELTKPVSFPNIKSVCVEEKKCGWFRLKQRRQSQRPARATHLSCRHRYICTGTGTCGSHTLLIDAILAARPLVCRRRDPTFTRPDSAGPPQAHPLRRSTPPAAQSPPAHRSTPLTLCSQRRIPPPFSISPSNYVIKKQPDYPGASHSLREPIVWHKPPGRGGEESRDWREGRASQWHSYAAMAALRGMGARTSSIGCCCRCCALDQSGRLACLRSSGTLENRRRDVFAGGSRGDLGVAAAWIELLGDGDVVGISEFRRTWVFAVCWRNSLFIYVCFFNEVYKTPALEGNFDVTFGLLKWRMGVWTRTKKWRGISISANFHAIKSLKWVTPPANWISIEN